MATPRVFIDIIKRIVNKQHIDFSNFTSTIKVNHEKWIENLLWISKFAFDHEWNYYKGNDVFSLIDYADTRGKLKNYSDNFDTSFFLKKYGCLSTIFKCNIAYKISCIEEIFQNFETNKNELISFFQLKSGTSIVKIELGKGDTHNKGKTTAIVYLSDHQKLIYKPRSGKLDNAFNALIEDLNVSVLEIDLKTPKVFNKESHSWFEFIAHNTAKNELQVKNYYKRCGVLLGIIYFLKGFDFHFENIIASAEYPVLVDLECMFYTNTKKYNILSSGFLPQMINAENTIGDISGLGADGTGESSAFWQWKNIDSDKLDLIKSKGTLRKENNQPLLNDVYVSPQEYVHQIIEGFQLICHWFFQQRTLNKIEKLLANFQNTTIRVLPRPTQSYSDILENSYLPTALTSEENRSKILDKYIHDFSFLPCVKERYKNEIRKSEKKALLRMDIPYFTANTSQTYLEESGEKITDNYFSKTPFDAIIERIHNIDENNIKEQVVLIKKAFKERYQLQTVYTDT